MTRSLTLLVALFSFSAAGTAPLPPLTDISLGEAEALGFEVLVTRDMSFDCVFLVRVSAPESIRELTVRSVGAGLLEGDEPIFASSGQSNGTDYHAWVSGQMLTRLVVIATYIGDDGGTVYRLRFDDQAGRCE